MAGCNFAFFNFIGKPVKPHRIGHCEDFGELFEYLCFALCKGKRLYTRFDTFADIKIVISALCNIAISVSRRAVVVKGSERIFIAGKRDNFFLVRC